MDINRRYMIWGSAGHAKVLNEIIQSHNSKVVALFDNSKEATSVLPNVPLIGGVDQLDNWLNKREEHTSLYSIVAIGGARGKDRINLQYLLSEKGFLIEPLIHLQAHVSNNASIGLGSQVLAMALIAADSYIGDACIINHKASIDHECNIQDGVHVAPGATLCGCVKVEKNVLIGAGATVLPRTWIGENSIVGAGSVVTKDIPPNSVVTGNPARIIKSTIEL